jgi:hypothetical protein
MSRLQQTAIKLIEQQGKSRPSEATAGNSSAVTAAPTAAMHRTLLPCSVFRLKPVELSTLLQDNPVFGTKSAAAFLGVSEELLKKWRQRGTGPAFIQYEPCGIVLYALDALLKYRAEHTIEPAKNSARGKHKERGID